MRGKTRIFAIITLLLACVGFGLLTDMPSYLKYKKGEIKDFALVQPGELKTGDLVQGEIEFTEGSIAEMETSNKTFGVTTSKETTSQYYAVYMVNDQCIIYETGNKEQWNTLDRMAKEYMQYIQSYNEVFSESGSNNSSDVELPTTTMTFTGKVKEMPTDLEKIFREWYGDDAAYAKEAESVVISNMAFDNLGKLMLVGIGCAALAVVMLIVTVISLIGGKKNSQFSY